MQITYIPSNAKTDTERDSTIYPNIPGSNSPAHDAQTRVPVDSTSTTGPADSSTGHASDSSIDGSSTPWPPDVMTHEYNYLKIGIRRLLQHGYPHDLQHTGAHRLLAADPSIPDGLAPQMVNGSAVVLGEWQQSPAVDTVTFVHLHSGSYQLQARALDNSGSPQRASEPYYFTVGASLCEMLHSTNCLRLLICLSLPALSLLLLPTLHCGQSTLRQLQLMHEACHLQCHI